MVDLEAVLQQHQKTHIWETVTLEVILPQKVVMVDKVIPLLTQVLVVVLLAVVVMVVPMLEEPVGMEEMQHLFLVLHLNLIMVQLLEFIAVVAVVVVDLEMVTQLVAVALEAVVPVVVEILLELVLVV